MSGFGDYIALKKAAPIHFKISQMMGWGPITRLEFFHNIPFTASFQIDLTEIDVENLLEQLKMALKNLPPALTKKKEAV